MKNGIFGDGNAMQLAGLAVMGGKGLGDALTQGMTQAAAMREQEQKQAEYERSEKMRQALPGLMSQIDFSNPQTALQQLMGVGLDPKTSVELVKSQVDVLQEQRLKEQQGMMTPYQTASLDLQRQAMNRRESPNAPSGYQFMSDGSLGAIPGGPADQKAQAAAQGKALPVTVLKELSTNQGALNKIDAGMDLTKKNPDAFGLDNLVTVDRLAKPENLAARASIADIGSQIVHDRSGAAVTISEYPRLKPFVPSATDSPKQVKVKLAQLKRGIKEITNGYLTTYETQGYNVKGFDEAPPQSSSPSKGLDDMSIEELQAMRNGMTGSK